ncbi:MAG: nucleotidyltransferase family protein [Candidatus Aminicenantes bacterium]|nr:nucleotidyltransferase family protein [Candidatus Aminicenantes bacterium]
MIKKRIAELDAKLSSEFEIILWAIREKGNEDNSEKLFESVDWEGVMSLSINHGTLPVVYKKISKLKTGLIPSEVLLRFKDVYHKIVRWNLIQSNQLIKVLKILKKNDIKAIPIKGPVISMQAYGDIGYRMFQDLDLIILPDGFINVYDLLCKEGYEPSIKLSEKKKKLWNRFRRDIEFKKGKTLIDIHQRISQGNSSFDIFKEQFERTEVVGILDQKIDVLSVEDTIVYLCINSAKDQWNSLRMVADLSFLIRSDPEIDWEVLIKNARSRGILRMILSGLLFISVITKESLPEIVMMEIQKDNRVKTLSEKYLSGAFLEFPEKKDPDIVKSLVKTLDSPSRKIRFLLYYFFTPGAADLRSIKLPAFLFPIYFLIRPLRLFKNIIVHPFKRG